MRIPSLRHWILASFVAALAACGGGEEGTSLSPQSEQNVVTSGAITGFGSVYVNGTHFETSGATITRDGQPARQQDLRVGQIVYVSGRIDDRTGRAVADAVHQDDNLEGPVTAIDATARTFVVLAHTVRVTPETSFDDGLGDFTALAVGLQVEISGMPDATGAIVATRIERRDAGETDLEVLGRVAALDTAARRFRVGPLVVDYATAALRDFGATGLANGQLVEVEGRTLDAGGALIATEVELRNYERRDGSFRREIEGLITRYVSPTDFDVAGRPVTTTASTRFEDGTAANLVLNAKVEVEGRIDAQGVLVASEIEFKRGGNAGVAGLVQAVTPDLAGLGGSLTVLGVTITVDNSTRIEDKSAARIEMFRLGNVQVGDYVEIRGTETAALRLTASRLERRRPRAEVSVRGTVRDLASPAFTVLGVPVTTHAGTEFDDMNAADFFARGAGRVVEVEGTVVNGQLVAREVEYEDSDD